MYSVLQSLLRFMMTWCTLPYAPIQPPTLAVDDLPSKAQYGLLFQGARNVEAMFQPFPIGE